ncbi:MULTISPECIES: protealysin inhibitor emfourin [unclassified Streptomyces]|uniref:protealysin inhibitor emfourin n=1 Tax=unclassified Streptomyces TaxID=2593676 RepID=UPI00364DAB31
MHIRVTRSGGFAGFPLKAELDTTGRPDAAELERLATAVLTQTGPGPVAVVPDGYRYSVTVDDRTVEFADPKITEEQEELVERVLRDGA